MSNSQTNYSTYGKFKPKNKSKKVIILIFTFIFVFTLCLFWLLNASSSTIVSFCEAKVKSNSTLAVNQSVYEVLSGAVNYKELVDIQEDSSGAVTLISADVMRINLLAYNVAMEVQKSVSEYSKTGIDIPIGTLLSTPIFTGQGFCINFQIMPIGNIICNVRSEFESAGINQTRH
ncbi:MAG: sporulation protein YunB, partial [Clostridia bacterium]